MDFCLLWPFKDLARLVLVISERSKDTQILNQRWGFAQCSEVSEG